MSGLVARSRSWASGQLARHRELAQWLAGAAATGVMLAVSTGGLVGLVVFVGR